MKPKTLFRTLNPGEEVEVSNLIARSFNEFIAPDFPEEGVEEFFSYANARALLKRVKNGTYFVLVGVAGQEIAGMIEVREMRHISMLFVDKAHHRKGIGKGLFSLALGRIKREKKPPKKVTVHSSRFAVPFYESLGFVKSSEEKIIHGVVHVPMELDLSQCNIFPYENPGRKILGR